MVHYMYRLALFVILFNIPKPTQFGRQISSKRSANTVLELLTFMQRKATVSVVMSPCTSVRPSALNNSAPTGRNLISGNFSTIQDSLKSDKIKGCFK